MRAKQEAVVGVEALGVGGALRPGPENMVICSGVLDLTFSQPFA
jgi:hypothetical protein